jgi:hypothetical protein
MYQDLFCAAYRRTAAELGFTPFRTVVLRVPLPAHWAGGTGQVETGQQVLSLHREPGTTHPREIFSVKHPPCSHQG